MARIFASLAVADLLVLLAAGVFGLFVDGDRLYPQHFGLAIFAAILTVLIHAIVITYFAAAARMISQAVFIGHLDREPLERIRQGKSRAVRWIGVGFAGIVFAVAIGALAARDSGWAWLHLVSAAVAITANAAAFYHQYDAIFRHARLMDEVLAEYTRKRSPANTR